MKGDKGRNFIDLYKRGSFVLESKQSRARREKGEYTQPDLMPLEVSTPRRDKSSRAWDVLMKSARQQAENYARHLPPDHDRPPFIIMRAASTVALRGNFRESLHGDARTQDTSCAVTEEQQALGRFRSSDGTVFRIHPPGG